MLSGRSELEIMGPPSYIAATTTPGSQTLTVLEDGLGLPLFCS